MKKNILGYCLLLVAVLLASCSKKNNYENVLPKDAAMVVSVDLVSMAEKSGLSGDKGAPVVARLNEALKSGAEGAGELIDKITKDPSESGLDLTEKVYYFIESGGVSTGLVMRVSDQDKLEDLLNALHNQQTGGSVSTRKHFLTWQERNLHRFRCWEPEMAARGSPQAKACGPAPIHAMTS